MIRTRKFTKAVVVPLIAAAIAFGCAKDKQLPQSEPPQKEWSLKERVDTWNRMQKEKRGKRWRNQVFTAPQEGHETSNGTNKGNKGITHFTD